MRTGRCIYARVNHRADHRNATSTAVRISKPTQTLKSTEVDKRGSAVTDAEKVMSVARALHASDRSGPWHDCAHKAAWLRWARVAIAAVRKVDAKCGHVTPEPKRD